MPDERTVPQTVILANGEYPAEGLQAALLHNAQRVVCCDGAANAFIADGGRPTATVGDGDSIDAATLACPDMAFVRNPDQETNDLTKVFDYCLSRGWKDIIILGATGRREDHTLANISLLADYARHARVQMVTPTGVFDAFDSTRSFASVPGQQVSIFTIIPGTEISVEGLVYIPAPGGFRSWWCGSLNEASADRFTIRTDSPTIVFRAFDVKHPVQTDRKPCTKK